MAEPSSTEAAALEEASAVLHFAAEKVKDLDPRLSLHIAEAREAAATNNWNPQVSQNFWSAFSQLCDLIRPVTIECITMSQSTIKHRAFTSPWRWRMISIAEYSSSRYFIGLIILLVIIVPLQLYIWACTNLIKQIDDNTTEIKTLLTKSKGDFIRLASLTGTGDHQYTADEAAQASTFMDNAIFIDDQSAKIAVNAAFLQQIGDLSLNLRAPTLTRTALDENWYTAHLEAEKRFNAAQAFAQAAEVRINLIIGVLASFVLPVLFAMTGAVAYVMRTISEQIRDTTFSPTTSVRHFMRVALGLLAGVVVGLFNGLSSQLNVSPLAVAFLAGYGVEALFSMFDGIIANFRQLRAQN